MPVDNPLHEIWSKLHEGFVHDGYMYRPSMDNMEDYARRTLECTKGRELCTDLYAWAVPTEEVIRALAEFSPIIEIGAGRGYWASLLQQAGADVRPYDVAPPQKSDNNTYHNQRHEKTPRVFTEVYFGNQAILHDAAPERTLFLCWPPYNTPMAHRCLTNYQGNHLIYVGEGYGGCTGDDAFHDLLEQEWEEILYYKIPQWWGIHDSVWVYERKKKTVG